MIAKRKAMILQEGYILAHRSYGVAMYRRAEATDRVDTNMWGEALVRVGGYRSFEECVRCEPQAFLASPYGSPSAVRQAEVRHERALWRMACRANGQA